jgi:hypothetical protein
MSSRTRAPSSRIVPADEADATPAAQPLPILATSMFCDDVRIEANGKLILIGCYPGNMMVLNTAQPVDHIWVFTKIIWPREFDPTGMRLRIDMPAQEPGFVDVQQSPQASAEISPGSTCVWQLRFLPLRPGDVIRIGVELGGHILPCGELFAVVQAAPPQVPMTRH